MVLQFLMYFRDPISVKEALKKLQNSAVGPQDWMDLMTTIVHLYEAGILREESRDRPVLKSRDSGYDSAPIHVAMLNDRIRTSRFLLGIREVIQKGDIVVDIGTGTGVFAVAAAQAGLGMSMRSRRAGSENWPRRLLRPTGSS